MTRFALSSRVVKFRRTGESARSEDDTASGEHEIQIEGVRAGLEAVELDDGAAVPKEFANPTDGEGPCSWGRPSSGALRLQGCLCRWHSEGSCEGAGRRAWRAQGDTGSGGWTCMAFSAGEIASPSLTVSIVD